MKSLILRILETATLNSTEINDYYLHLEAKISYLFSEIMKVALIDIV
jgi:hypothetical protein